MFLGVFGVLRMLETSANISVDAPEETAPEDLERRVLEFQYSGEPSAE